MKIQQIKCLSKAELSYKLGCLMSEVKNKVKHHILAKIRERGTNLSFEMAEVLGYLWKNDGINQQEIADLTFRDKSSITYLVDNLVDRNIVTRVEDKNDRRNKLIYLTQEGQCLKEQLQPKVAEVYEKISEELEIEELQASIVVLNKIIYKLVTL
jgi:DNA-binding MarR family transcriptional regulator